MSSWLAALGPCASPKSKAKERKNDGSLEKPLNISSLKRRGSLTDVRQSRKVATSRSFREKIQDTFDGSLRKAKKAGSLEAVAPDAHTYRNPDTNMNVSTSLSPKNYKGSSSGSSFTGPEQAVKDKFWTNFYNTLPRNRHKGDRPKDLSLQDLPVTEKDTEIDIEKDPDMELKVQSSDGQWSGYATSPRTKRKAKTLERMNSAPNTRKMGYDGGEKRAASDGKASPQIIDGLDEGFDNGSGFVVMPRSVSLQDEYWMPTHKGGSKMELRRVTPSPDRLGVRRSPVASPVQLQGHVWVKTKDGAHMELRAIERHPREIPSPSESQKTDTSSLSYATAASSLSNLDIVPRFPAEDMVMGPGGQVIATTQSPDQAYTGPYMSPEEYQANIFELIQSLNQSPPNPSSPEFKRSREGKEPRSPDKPFHTEKFIVLGSPSSPEAPGSKAEGQGSRPEDYEKREQPIFSVRAHVFQIDPDTKKNWLPASKSAVAVSYYYDSARNTYRIISVEGSKAIINSTITPNMAFTKTSQKFGQWSDPRANTVYGLGFGTEADLAKFIDKFKEVKDMTRQQMSHQNQSPTTVNGTSEDGGHTPSSSNNTTPREPPPRNFFHTRSSSLTSMREPAQQNEQKDVNLRERRNSFNTPGSNGNAGSNSPESQIKYENDRLKLALAQSSANAKKWEIELQTLKNNNARLTAALQESTTNVDEWKKQLAGYKDETGRMKKKIVELEKNQGGQDQVASLQSEMGDLKNSVETLQRENRYKDEEVDRLQQRLAEMTTRETANGNLQNKLKALEDENRTLHKRVNELQQLLQDHRSSQDSEKQELVQLQDHLGSKITELYEFHEQVMSMIHKESNS